MSVFLDALGSVAVAATSLFAVSAMASAQPAPRISYGSQTAQDVTVVYYDLPAGTLLMFVNQLTGVKTPAVVVPLIGSGSVAVPFVTLPSGAGHYYVLAQWNGQVFSQTVPFYVNKS